MSIDKKEIKSLNEEHNEKIKCDNSRNKRNINNIKFEIND